MQDAAERAPRKGALIFIFITVALDIVALGVIAPVFVPLVEGFMHEDVAAAAGVVGVFGTVFALMQFVWAPVLGVLSDRFGRRPIIVLSNLGMGVDYVVMALAPNLMWLLLGRVVSGITSATATASSAYIADVTPAEKRAAAFGMVGAAFGVGFVLGPAIGGLCGQVDPRLPFWVAGALCLLNGVYGAFVLPESLAPEHRALRFLWSKANPVGALRLLQRHRELTALGILTFASTLAGIAMQSTWVLYVTGRYGWKPGATGVSLAVLGVCSSASQIAVIGPFVKRYGERAALFGGVVFGLLSLLIFGFAPNGWWFSIGIVPLCLWGLAPAAAQAIMTRRVSAREQGELQGAIGSIRGLSTVFGPLIFTTAFAFGIAHGVPGLNWFVAAVFLCASVLPVLRDTSGAGDEHDSDVTEPMSPRVEMEEMGEPVL
ncbi:MAG TPA: TCR/Tet family MFS transporter [Candidatus Elarobacter sp.]|nr:TCR/Tet family MFS transporter [Candidatus Elarobacter sp.]